MFAKSLKLLIFGLTLSFIMSACGGLTAEKDAESIVIYSGRSETLVGPLIEQFTADTGIKVDIRYGDTAELAATLLEEGENSPADIFFAQEPGGLGVVAEAGLLAKLPDNLTNLVDSRFAAPNHSWVGVSGRARVIVYNTEVLSPEDLPEDLWGFTDPKWKGKIGLPPTNASFQTMVTAMRQQWGEENTRLWLEGIMANEPLFYEKNTPTVAAVGAGEVEVGFVNHYYLYRFLAEEGESFPARNYFLPAGGPGSLVLVSGAGLLSTSQNQESGLTFIEYLLSEKAQTYFSDETFEYPLAAQVPPSVNLPPLASLNAVEINLADLADLQGTVQLMQDVGMLP